MSSARESGKNLRLSQFNENFDMIAELEIPDCAAKRVMQEISVSERAGK